MISVDEALARILMTVPVPTFEACALSEAAGSRLAVDITAPCDLPPWTNSAMDGYAIRADDTNEATVSTPVALQIVESIAAGTAPCVVLQPGMAARIMTGAMLPDGATAVVMQEEVVSTDTTCSIVRAIRAGEHVRRAGEEVRRGQPVLAAGTRLTPAACGLLAALGLAEVMVRRRPRVAILPTGNELVAAGQPLAPAQIYESNATTLQALLTAWRITPSHSAPVADTPEALWTAIRPVLAAHDLVILTGGVSAGAFDHVRDALSSCGVEPLFWRVAQKPGMPMFAGRTADTLVLGLPGNPASTLVCAYLYLRPWLQHWFGDAVPSPVVARLATAVTKKTGREHWLHGLATAESDGWSVTADAQQGSHCLHAFARANCLVRIPADVTACAAGTPVDMLWLDAESGGR